MSEPTSEPRRLSAAQARRLLSALSLRPGERILCLGPDGGPVPSVAAILVGPTGRIVEANPAAVTAGEPLPHPDDEFDAVIIDVIAPHPHQTHLLAEAGRVTAPTGRIALATPPPSNQKSASAPQLAEAAGLRGVAVRSDTATEADTEPVELMTAFPPRPAGSGEDDVTARTAEFHPPKPASEPGQPSRSRRRHLLLAGSVAALVVAAVVGVVWGLASDDPDQGAQASQSGLADDATGDVEQPGPQDADEPLAGGGTPTDSPGDESDSGSGSASESGSSSGSESGSGGGQPSNKPPIIDSPGLMSDGLVLIIEPEVSDPDDDEVSLLFEVDGTVVDPSLTCSTPCKVDEFSVELDFADVGYRSDVAVTITATDSRGATTRETYSHTVEARTRVTFTFLEVTIDDPAACFSADDVRSLSYSLELSGAINRQLGSDRLVSEQISGWRLVNGVTEDYVGEQPPPLGVLLSVTLEGIGTAGFAAPRQYPSNADEVLTHWRNGPCEYTLIYGVRFETT